MGPQLIQTSAAVPSQYLPMLLMYQWDHFYIFMFQKIVLMPSAFIYSVKCSGNLSSRAAALGGAGQAHQHGQVMPPGGGGGGQHPPHVAQSGGGDHCVLEKAEEQAGGQLPRPAGDGG